jgi:hypothetical protein
VQFTSGIFSIASHSVLQYFPSVTWQVQIGCAHFLAAIVFFSWLKDSMNLLRKMSQAAKTVCSATPLCARAIPLAGATSLYRLSASA